MFAGHVTPRLTKHARERCEEMGISTKVAKQIVRHADTNIPGNRGTGCMVARWSGHPRYRAVYYVAEDGVPVIVTVDFYSIEPYVRDGQTFRPKWSEGGTVLWTPPEGETP